jgi:hypothetical protein
MTTINLSDSELADAARGLRSLVKQAEEDAKRQENPSMRELFERNARSHQALMEKFEAARNLRKHLKQSKEQG